MATAMAAMVLTAAPAAAVTAHPSDTGRRTGPQASAEITSVSPGYARPGQKVTVSGVASNLGSTTLTGLSVDLWSSGVRLANRQAMTTYLTTEGPTFLDAQQGLPTPVFSLAPHATRRWSLTLSVNQVGMHSFGVYPLAAQLSGPLGPINAARTFLPFWPGKAEQKVAKPLSVAWVWPLIDAPQQAECRALRTTELPTSLAPGGRLDGLLSAGSTATAVAAKLTWAIDPALISDATLLTHPYRIGADATCTGGTRRPADRAAGNWLAGVGKVTSKQNFFVTPYADVDVAALQHRGLDPNLASAFRTGRDSAGKSPFLHRWQRTTPSLAGQIAWPPGGIADYGVLEDLAHNRVGTVILDSNLMRPVTPPAYTPSAVSSTAALYGRLHILLADHTLAQILAAPAAQIPGMVPPPSGLTGAAATQSATFTKEQWFLAETAMIAAEAPGTARSVVVMPPRRWNPPAGMAGDLLSQTAGTPWLRPASLASLVTARHGKGTVRRRQPPQHRVSPGELRGSLLRQDRTLTGQIQVLAHILTTAGHDYLGTALAVTESSAWRGNRASQRRAEQLLHRVSTYVRSQLQQVSIVHSLHITLGGKSGSVPVSVSNHLNRDIRVKVEVRAPTEGRVQIGQFKNVVTVAAQTQRLVKIPVRSAADGSSTLTLWLATPGGKPLPVPTATLTVQATHFGTLAIVIIVVALVVFVTTAAGRAIMRGSEPDDADTNEVDEDGERTGEPVGAAEIRQTPPAGPDRPSGGAEADSVVAAGAADPDPVKEADDHARTPGRPHRL